MTAGRSERGIMYYLRKGSRCAFTCNRGPGSVRGYRRGLISAARRLARRACVRAALGAHCSISEAGTATPPDWAIHHRRAARAPRRRPPALRGEDCRAADRGL